MSRPFPSWIRSILTEIYLCHACSCQDILRTETAGQDVDLDRRWDHAHPAGRRAAVHRLGTGESCECDDRPAASVHPPASTCPAQRLFEKRRIARQALELGNPEDALEGVLDPLREVTQWKLVLLGLLYKAKIFASNFLMKVALKRVLTRAAARTVLPFVAILGTAFWDGAVGYTVVGEAKLIAMGVSASAELADALIRSAEVALATTSTDGSVAEGAGHRSGGGGGGDVDGSGDASPDSMVSPLLQLSQLGRLQAARAVACMVVRKRTLHPTHQMLLLHVCRVLQIDLSRAADLQIDDPSLFLGALPRLPEPEVALCLGLICLAMCDLPVTPPKCPNATDRLTD
eukprot:COSAG01_NODE_716_length_14085_cov_18.724010_7_plen_345_part_00